MSQQKNNLRLEERACSDEDHTSLSDLRKLMEKHFGYLASAIQEVNGRVMKLEERLSIGMKSDMIGIKTHSFGPRCLKLVFKNKISLPVRSGEEIKGEGGKYLEVALVDDVTGNVVDFGCEASAHVEIVALEGDSDDCKTDTWVIGNYKNKIAGVLVGKVKLKLNKGIGSLVNIKFRNSSNHNSGVFKLGARVIDSFDGTLVKEAMTESIVVRDFREKYKQKHYPPSLSDEVWRLENIQKGGAIHERLKEKVKTVEDFLIELLKDSSGLKCLLGLPEKKWKATIHHAQTCTINQKVYGSINSQENKGVVFNVVGRILGLIKDWNYLHFDMLSQEEKDDATKLLGAAFQHKEGVKDFDNEAFLLQYLSRYSTAMSANSPRPENTVTDEVGTSKRVEFDQANTDASSQDVLSSKNPSRGTVCQEAEASVDDRFDEIPEVVPSIDPTGGARLEAPLHGPVCIDQYNVDEMNLNSSSQDVCSSKNPSRGTVYQEAKASVDDRFDEFPDVIPSVNPTGGTRLEAPLHGPICTDQYTVDAMNLNSSSQDVLQSNNPCGGTICHEAEASALDRFDLQDIFPSINPTGVTGLETPIFSPDQENVDDASFRDALLSWSPSGGEVSNEVEASERHGFSLHGIFSSIHLTGDTGLENFGSHGVEDMEMGTNCSQRGDLSLGPLWIDQYNFQPSSSSLIDNDNWLTQVLAGESHSNDLSSETDIMKVKKAAFKGNRLKKKQRIS